MDVLVEQRPDFAGDPHVRALVFVRQRTHHNWASAIRFDSAASVYVWQPESNIPLPRNERNLNEEGERRYAELFVGQPIQEALVHLEKRVIALASAGSSR